jgi:hypothetical protein
MANDSFLLLLLLLLLLPPSLSPIVEELVAETSGHLVAGGMVVVPKHLAGMALLAASHTFAEGLIGQPEQ